MSTLATVPTMPILATLVQGWLYNLQQHSPHSLSADEALCCDVTTCGWEETNSVWHCEGSQDLHLGDQGLSFRLPDSEQRTHYNPLQHHELIIQQHSTTLQHT